MFYDNISFLLDKFSEENRNFEKKNTENELI
jgi:hypothetical protein